MSPEDAQRCDCGHDFVTGTLQPSYLTARDQRAAASLSSGDIVLCILLPVVGLIMGLVRLRRHQPTAPSTLRLAGAMLVAWFVLRVLAWSVR
jgi:threonine/homoserine/homoserine lactone efflux protein